MTFLMRFRGVGVLLALMVVLVLLLTGCGSEPTAVPTEPPEPTEVSAAPPTPTTAPTEPPPTPTDTPTLPPPTATPTEEPTPTPVPVDDTACVSCHTDEETLKAVAEEPEETEALSEGEG
jgi:outer membrane biosynthesis protein TonB